MARKKTWKEKLNIDREPEVEVTEKSFADVPSGSRMAIVTPRIMDEFVRKIPKGRTLTIAEIRAELARQFDADYTCPLTTGIFLRIVAEAAFEDLALGKGIDEITPFWRAIDPKSSTAKKLTFGTELLQSQRQAEAF